MSDTRSVYWDVLKAVRKRVLTVATNLDETGVRVRKRLAFVRETDPLPFVCVAPEAEVPGDQQFGGTIFVDYPVTVALFDEGAMVLEGAGLERWLWLRQSIRQVLHTPTAHGIVDVFDVTSYEPDVPFDRAAFDQGIDVAVQRVVYRSRETREG